MSSFRKGCRPNEIPLERQKLKVDLEENRTSTLTIGIIKAQALELNEKLATKKKEFLNMLSKIQVGRENQLKLKDGLI
jgi:hypothetical protein